MLNMEIKTPRMPSLLPRTFLRRINLDLALLEQLVLIPRTALSAPPLFLTRSLLPAQLFAAKFQPHISIISTPPGRLT